MIEKTSHVDRIFRKLLLSKFFTKGWGSPSTIKRQFDFLRVLADRSQCQRLVNENYPVIVDSDVQKGDVRILDGHFRSPLDVYLPNVMPQEVRTARFQLVVPTKWPSNRKPICIHMAGTGDHFFWRRRTFLARPLIKECGIGSLILENPFYGYRKPKGQLRSSLRHVNELFVMGGGLILEGLVMLHWLEKRGFGPLGLTGISMGGHMASLTATNWHKPIPLIPCLSWSSATPVFTEGVLSGAIPWPVLVTQYLGQHLEYEQEIKRKLHKCPKTDAHSLGQEFAWNYPESVESLKEMYHQPDNSKESDTHSVTSSVDSPTASLKDYCSGSLSNNVSDRASSAASDCQHRDNSSSKDSRSPVSSTNYSECSGSPPEAGADERISLSERNITEDETKNLTDHKKKNSNSNSDQSNSYRIGMEMSAIEVGQLGKINLYETLVRSFRDLISKNEDQRTKTDLEEEISSTKEGKRKAASSRANSVNGVENYQDMKQEALEFMRGVMDVTTFVGNFSTPVDPSLVIVVTALRDAYIPRKGVPGLNEIWSNVEVRYVDCGHVTAFLFKQTEFRKAISDAFNKYYAKYENENLQEKGKELENGDKS